MNLPNYMWRYRAWFIVGCENIFVICDASRIAGIIVK